MWQIGTTRDALTQLLAWHSTFLLGFKPTLIELKKVNKKIKQLTFYSSFFLCPLCENFPPGYHGLCFVCSITPKLTTRYHLTLCTIHSESSSPINPAALSRLTKMFHYYHHHHQHDCKAVVCADILFIHRKRPPFVSLVRCRRNKGQKERRLFFRHYQKG